MKERNRDIQIARHKEILPSINNNISTFREAKNTKTELEWSALASRTVAEGIELWLSNLSRLTAKNYASGMRQLAFLGYIDISMSLQGFALMNFEAVLDRIKKDPSSEWSECSRQARAACYISFTGFLARRFPAIFRKAVACKDGVGKTFYCVRQKVHTKAMTPEQWRSFLVELFQLNPRDSLIARLAIQGGKRINEVLSLNIQQIDWKRGEISFTQSKTKGEIKHTIITYPQSVLNELQEYLAGRVEGLVFVSKSGRPVFLQYIAKTFAKAGLLAGIPFPVSSHCLRASCVTHLKTLNFSDSDIMKITGHASASMVYAYDKSDQAQNASKKVNLVE